MDAEKIIQDLNRRFAAPLPEFFKRRIIVWIDEDAEFADALDEITLTGAKIIALTGSNNFAVKKLLAVDDPTGNYLVYRPFAVCRAVPCRSGLDVDERDGHQADAGAPAQLQAVPEILWRTGPAEQDRRPAGQARHTGPAAAGDHGRVGRVQGSEAQCGHQGRFAGRHPKR